MNLLPPFSIRLSRRGVLKHFAAGSLGAASLPNFASNEKLAAVSGITIRDDLGEHVFQTIPQRPAVLQWDLLENLVVLGHSRCSARRRPLVVLEPTDRFSEFCCNSR